MPAVDASTIKDIEFPGLGCPLSRLNGVKSVQTEAGRASVEINLPVPGYPHKEELTAAITEKIQQADSSLSEVNVQYHLQVRGPESGAGVGLRVKHVIAVGSGKGGVGKSTVAASLAYALKSMGAKVGLLDADVYGPSIPHLTGATGKPEVREHLNTDGKVIQRIHPVEHQEMKVMSIGFLIPEQEAVIWRGPMLHKMLTQFVSETEWGELDYLIVDMPPGTGDVALTLSQMLSLSGAVVVCTPQKVALLDAVKAIGMYEKVNIPVLGMVENMTGEIFGRGGAEQAAVDRSIPFLGEVPTDASIRIHGDESKMQDLFTQENNSRTPLENVAVNMAMQAARQFVAKPAAPTFEILQ